MPDPKLKKKKSLEEIVADAGNEVLGQSQSVSNTTMSDDDLLATFGESEKKKDTPSSQGLPKPQVESQEQIPPSFQESTEILKPKEEKSGNGSLNRSSSPIDNGVNPVMSAMAKTAQSFYDLPAQLLEASAIAGRALENKFPIGDAPKSVEDSWMIKASNNYRNWLKEIAPTNPKTEAEDPYYSHTIGASLGDLAALVTSGGSRATAKALNKLTTESIKSGVSKLVIQEGKNYITSPSVLVGALQMGTSEWEQAKQSGATDEQAFEVFYKNAIVGSALESVPVMHFFKRLDKATGGGVKEAIKKGATQGIEEMTTEIAQGLYSNYTASETYDATRKLYNGLTESGGIGFGLGFMLGAMGASLKSKQKIAQTPQEKAEIQKSIDFVDSKLGQMQEGKLDDHGLIQQKEEIPTQESIEQEAIVAEETFSEPTAEEQNIIQDDNAVIATDEAPVQEQLPEESNPLVEEAQQEVVDPTQEIVEQPTEELTVPVEEINTEQTQEPVIQEEQIEPLQETISVEPTPEVSEPINSEAIKKETIVVKDEPVKETGKHKPNYKIKQEEQSKKKEIQARPRTSPTSLARGYFLDGGKVKWDQSESQKITGSQKSSVRKELNFGSEERKLHAFRMTKDGPTVESIAESLHEQLPEELKERYDTNDMRNAVLDVLNENPKNWYDLQNRDTNETFNEEEYLRSSLSAEDIVAYEDYLSSEDAQNLFDSQKEGLAKQYDEYIQSEEYKQLLNEQKNESGRKSISNVENQQAQRAQREEQIKLTEDQSREAIRKYGNTPEDRKTIVSEINTKPLSHVSGIGMGQNQAEGTYLSTEKVNRYSGQGGKEYTAKVSISSPLRMNQNDFFDMQREVLVRNFPFMESIEDLSDSQIQELAKTMTDLLKKEGYDSVYFPESDTQEGELIVFDKGNVELTEKQINTGEELEADLIDHVSSGGDVNDISAIVDNKDDVEIIKDYVDENIKQRDKPVDGENKGLEEESTETSEGSGPIRALRDKVESLNDIKDEKERARLAEEIIEEVDAEINKIEPQETSNLEGKEVTFEKPDGTIHTGTILKVKEGGILTIQGKNKLKYDVKLNDIITFNQSYPKEKSINTRSDINVSVNANKGKTDINDMVGIVGINEFFGINVSDITKFTKKGKEFFQKWLTSRGFIPESVFKSWVGTEGNINAELSKMKYQIADFRRAIKKAYNLSFGQELSTTAKTEINSALGGNKESMANLPSEAQEAVSDMRAHIDYLSQRMISEGIVTGDLAGKFQENMGIYLFRSFRKHDDPDWVQDIDPMIVNKAKGYIQQQYPGYTVDEIDGIINELLYTPDAPMHLIKTGKLGSKDLSILKKRKELAPEIRALYGEYTDPLVNYSKSIMKMINIIEKHKFLEDVKSQGMDKFLFEKPTGNNSALIAGEKSTTMAPLNGLYTTPEIASAFEEFNASANLPKWMEYYMKAISTVKSAKTVLNITTHARNIIGNIAFVIANGHYNVLESSDAFKTIKTDIISADNKKFREAYQRYQKLGIVGDSSSAGELKAMLEDAKLKPDKFDYVNTIGIKKAKKAVTQFIGDAYQAEDDFYKIYAFENEFKRYKEAYGDTKTDEEVEKIAADIVRNTYPTYSKTSKLIKELRKAPVLGTFISFPAEVIRTTYNTAEITRNELKSDNPKIKAIGAKRLAGQLISASLTATLAATTKYLYSISDEEEEKVRDFVAPWSKNSLFFYTGPLKDGKANMIDLSQTDPHGFWQKPIISLLDGEDLEKGAIDAVKELLTPFFGLNMVTEALIDLKNNEKTTGQKITNPSLPLGDRALDYASYVYDFAKPGTLNSIDRISKGAKLKGEPDEYGKIYNFGDETLAALGGQRISSIDINKSFSFIARDLKDKLTQDKQIYTRFKLKEQSWMSPEEKEAVRKQKDEALNKATEATIKSVENMRKYYFGAIRLGVPKEAAKATLKENKIPKDIIKLVFSEVPLEKMKVDWYVKGVNNPISADEYIKMKIKD